MEPPQLDLLTTITIETGAAGFRMGAGTRGQRRIGAIRGGFAEGPGLVGPLFAGGGDWAVIDTEGTIHIDMRCMVETGAGEGVLVTQVGRVAAPAGPVREAVMDRARWGDLDPASYYYRTVAQFEAATDGPHAWLNRVVAVGRGRHRPGAVEYTLWIVR